MMPLSNAPFRPSKTAVPAPMLGLPTVQKDDLKIPQQLALERVQRVSKPQSDAARLRLIGLARQCGYSFQDAPIAIQKVETYVATKCPITIRLDVKETLPHLLKDSLYRNAFETNHKGLRYLDKRRRWESDMFHGAYDHSLPHLRPKYGCLNMTAAADGDIRATRYGQTYLLLKDTVRPRTTFVRRRNKRRSYDGEDVATLEHCCHVLLECDFQELSRLLVVATGARFAATSQASGQINEVHIHGMVDMQRDVEAIVVPAEEMQLGSRTCELATEFGQLYNVPVVMQEDLRDKLQWGKWSKAFPKPSERKTDTQSKGVGRRKAVKAKLRKRHKFSFQKVSKT